MSTRYCFKSPNYKHNFAEFNNMEFMCALNNITLGRWAILFTVFDGHSAAANDRSVDPSWKSFLDTPISENDFYPFLKHRSIKFWRTFWIFLSQRKTEKKLTIRAFRWGKDNTRNEALSVDRPNSLQNNKWNRIGDHNSVMGCGHWRSSSATNIDGRRVYFAKHMWEWYQYVHTIQARYIP